MDCKQIINDATNAQSVQRKERSDDTFVTGTKKDYKETTMLSLISKELIASCTDKQELIDRFLDLLIKEYSLMLENPDRHRITRYFEKFAESIYSNARNIGVYKTITKKKDSTQNKQTLHQDILR